MSAPLTFLFLAQALAQNPEEPPFSASIADINLSPGQSGKLTLVITVPEKHHIYKDQIRAVVEDAGGVKVAAASLPPALNKDDPASPGQKREVYEDDVYIDFAVEVPATATAAELPIKIRAGWQGCRDGYCYPGQEALYMPMILTGAAGGQALDAGAAPAEGEVSVRFTPKVGEPGFATVEVATQGEWHLNKAFMSWSLPDGSPYTLGTPTLPEGKKTGSEADGTAREDLEGTFTLQIPVSGPAGPVTLPLSLGYQACKGVAICKMPTSEVVQVPVVVGAGGAAQAAAPSTAPTASTANASGGGSAFEAARSQGLLALIALCFAAGVGVSFTPCVLPMVPITLGVIGARSAGNRLRAFSLAATYVAGLALVYTLLGVFAGVTGSLFGAWLQSPWVGGGIGLLFFVMGFSMFGFFDIQMPSFIMSRVQGGSGGQGGYVGALVVGMIGALVAGPCSGPVVASILAMIGGEGQVGVGALLMAVFSLGMGMIFLVTGAASGWLPSRGAWMVTVKKAFGILMWLGAAWYIDPLLPDVASALLFAAVLLVTGVFAWPDPEDGEGFYMQRARQLYAIVAGIVGAYLLVGALLLEGFILPPVKLAAAGGAASGEVASGGIAWMDAEEPALAKAKAEGKILMIDFTAEWCTACHEMEKYTYTDARVIAEAAGVVPVMLDCTKDTDPLVKAVQKKYGVVGLPTVVFVSPDGTMLGKTIGFVVADEFVQTMKQMKEKHG